jgi:hypothetical protein
MPADLTDRGGGVVSADLLKKAAALMRERAETARNGSTQSCQCDQHVAYRSAFHTNIALWDSAVAMAVADWLDHDARIHMNHSGTEVCAFDLPSLDDTPALRVARAYLGET